MRSIKLALAVTAAIITLTGCGSKTTTQLVPAWQLFPEDSYRGVQAKDPFVSWSPDSKTLLTSGITMHTEEQPIMRWTVGDSKLEKVGEGLTPSFINADEFVFLRGEPKGIFVQNLKTGEQKEIMNSVKNCSFWSETEGINYDPQTKSVALRLTQSTPRYLRGTELYDLKGKSLGSVSDSPDPDVVELSADPSGKQCALLVQQEDGQPTLLEVAAEGKTRGKQIASGSLYGVAWSPTADIIAYGDGPEVAVVRPSDGKKVVVGRFGSTADTTGSNYVNRVSWSPDGKYLAALYYVSSDSGDYPLVYVLDMSKFKWDR